VWDTKTRVIPVVDGALGTVRVGLKEYLNEIPGQETDAQVQKIALLGTFHIYLEVHVDITSKTLETRSGRVSGNDQHKLRRQRNNNNNDDNRKLQE
jgi:hypothetical protein